MISPLSSWDPNWKRRYNSPPDDLIKEFYVPAFRCATHYDRAVGFFSSSLLAALAPSIDHFVGNNGIMRLITSPANLTDDDLMAMGKGSQIRDDLRLDLEQAITRTIPNQVQLDRLSLLVWMIGTGRLEVKLALREHATQYSLFHEKIGVFSDSEQNWMTFTGSPNETMGGACRHSESFPLHRSWASEDQMAYAVEERDRFADVWNDDVTGIRTWAVTEWIEEPMRQHFGVREPKLEYVVRKIKGREELPPIEEASVLVDATIDQMTLLPSLPSELKLHDYQREAVNAWLKCSGRGIFAMATGTGKTITALAAATQAARHSAANNKPLLILVIVPLLDLVGQWKEDAEWFGFRPVVCHGGLKKKQRSDLKSAFSSVRSSSAMRAEMIITTADSLTPRTNTSFDDHEFQRQLSRHLGPLLVIGDEMHSLGSSTRLSSLPVSPTFTLGLSATPKRHGDEEGTDALVTYFGEPVIAISIKEAIYKYKTLVEYDYKPMRVNLTADETTEYKKLSARIAAAYANDDLKAAESAIRLRNRIKQHAVNKMRVLRELLGAGLKDETHQIFYIAEGKHPESEHTQLDLVEEMLRDEFGMNVALYYGDTSATDREYLQKRLADGEVSALLAMKCLDEGVDIPSVRIGVITASTQNPRQFVQRRGRLLRRDPVNPKSHAIIYDFIVLPLPEAANSTESEKTLIAAELSRAAELADASMNRDTIFDIIEWAYKHNLDDEQYPWMKLSGDNEMSEWIR